MLVAAPKSMEDQQMSGTWAVIRYARIRSVTTVLLHPEADGTTVEPASDKVASRQEKGNMLVRNTRSGAG